jgi:8-amino-7-oxononanoate synthase
MIMSSSLERKLHSRLRLGNLRCLKLSESGIDFASNDYLGLARSSQMKQLVVDEWNSYDHQLNGVGSTGSRLLTGNSEYALKLEEDIARFHGYETSVLFGCGYMANVGLISAVASHECVIFFDAAIHASTRDGIRLSRAKAFAFKHNDVEHLERRLKNCSEKGERFICVESMYSTDGSIAPLVEICRCAKKYAAHVIVDEAHATGVFGQGGRGLVFEYNLVHDVFAQITTFGKAVGVYGAVVLGSHFLKQILINFSTSYIYTTSLPFTTLASIKCSYDLFPNMNQEREHLYKLIDVFRNSFTYASFSQIQFVPIEGNQAVRQMSKRLLDEGFDVRALMSPTVQRGDERLRICLHAFNTENDLMQLIHIIKSQGF